MNVEKLEVGLVVVHFIFTEPQNEIEHVPCNLL